MRILHVIASADPTHGGPIEGILQQAQARHEIAVSTEIVCLDDPTDPWLKRFPVPVHAVGSLRRPDAGLMNKLPWVHYRWSYGLVPWLNEHAHRFDIIVVNGIWNYIALGARRALTGGKHPYIVFPHGMLDPWFLTYQPLKGMVKRLVWHFVEGPLLNGADGVLYTTEDERLLARNSFKPYRPKEFVINYGTGDIPGDPVEQVVAFRRHLPALGDRPYLLYLSRIHPKKGVDLLIEAFAAFAQERPELQLVIAGPDKAGLKDNLQDLARRHGIADRILWPGMVTGDLKWGAFRGAEAFILPSHQENFGIVVAEAMAAGVPVLITNKVNIWREVEETGSGIIGDDTLDGVKAILRTYFALSAEDRYAMGQRARTAFLDRFEIHRVVNSINKVLRGIVAEWKDRR